MSGTVNDLYEKWEREFQRPTFDPNAPLPPMRSHGKDIHDSWEPASRRFKDIEPETEKSAL